MTPVRLLRIGGIAVAFATLFTLSQAVTAAQAGSNVPGTRWAVGVLTLLFLVRAIVTEWSRGPEENLQKDILWGLAGGGIGGILATTLALG